MLTLWYKIFVCYTNCTLKKKIISTNCCLVKNIYFLFILGGTLVRVLIFILLSSRYTVKQGTPSVVGLFARVGAGEGEGVKNKGKCHSKTVKILCFLFKKTNFDLIKFNKRNFRQLFYWSGYTLKTSQSL